MNEIASCSVIIPVYKYWDILENCLDSLAKQSYGENNFEIIVVNNEEKEFIPNYLAKYHNVILIHEPKPGSYTARNAAIKIAKGNILAFTDADCIAEPDWLLRGINNLKSDTGIGVVAGQIKVYPKNYHKFTFAEAYDMLFAFNQKANAKKGACVTANWFSYKDVLLSHGCFDANLKSGGDVNLSDKIAKSGLKVVYEEMAIVKHPARYDFSEIVNKRQRIIGGKYHVSKKRSRYIDVMLGSFKRFYGLLIKIKRDQSHTVSVKMKAGVSAIGLLFVEVFELTSLLFGTKAKR